ncbi:MAG: cupin domain-containing protein [Myxococcota bacterium]
MSETTFDLSQYTVGLSRSGGSSVQPNAAEPPRRVDGLVVGAPFMTRNAPHSGEMHPDGDELLYLISGRVDVVLEEGAQEHSVELAPGQALVVPRGVWHRVLLREPSQLLYITPGPGGEHRPLARNGE